MARQSHPFTRIDTAPSAAATAFRPATLSLVRELIQQLATLARQELALAGAELGRSLGSLTAGLASLAMAAAVMFIGFLVLLAAAGLALSTVLAGWLAALIVSVAVLALGAGLLLQARRRLQPAAVAPQRSPESLRRDRDMVARHLS